MLKVTEEDIKYATILERLVEQIIAEDGVDAKVYNHTNKINISINFDVMHNACKMLMKKFDDPERIELLSNIFGEYKDMRITRYRKQLLLVEKKINALLLNNDAFENEIEHAYALEYQRNSGVDYIRLNEMAIARVHTMSLSHQVGWGNEFTEFAIHRMILFERKQHLLTRIRVEENSVKITQLAMTVVGCMKDKKCIFYQDKYKLPSVFQYFLPSVDNSKFNDHLTPAAFYRSVGMNSYDEETRSFLYRKVDAHGKSKYVTDREYFRERD
jgi:hypothetical protein